MLAKNKKSMLFSDESNSVRRNKKFAFKPNFLETQFPSLNEVKIQNNRLVKNNSFDENSSPVKVAMAANLGAAPDECDEGSLMRQPRSRLISDGPDLYQLQNLNENTHDMIKSDIHKL